MMKAEIVSTGICAILLLAISAFVVHDVNTSQSGYVAVYAAALMWMLCIFALVVGLALVFFRRTRRLGIVAVTSGLLLPCVFFAGIRISKSAGWISWENQPLQRLGPDVQASEVVYYNLGVTHAQMESFERTSLHQARADGLGFDFKPGITYYLGLLPSQAHGHNAFAIGISPSLPKSSRDQLRSTLAQSSLVFRVFDDKAPKDIPVP